MLNFGPSKPRVKGGGPGPRTPPGSAPVVPFHVLESIHICGVFCFKIRLDNNDSETPFLSFFKNFCRFEANDKCEHLSLVTVNLFRKVKCERSLKPLSTTLRGRDGTPTLYIAKFL